MSFQNVRYELRKKITEKPKQKILLYWLLHSAFGIVIIKTIIRPRHLHLSETFDFLQGTLPNLFAGAIFCVLAFVNYGAFKKKAYTILRKLIFAFIFSFLGLTLWEYFQYFMGYPIDYFDILMTALGSLLTIILILLLRIK
jgi:hypothetical protein